MVQPSDRILQVKHLQMYDEQVVTPIQSSITTLGQAALNLTEVTERHTRQINNLDPNSGELVLQINPDPEPTTIGAIWLVSE